MTTLAPPVRFTDSEMAIRFDRFDAAAYALFLKCKRLPESRVDFDDTDESYTITAPARFAELLGVQRPAIEKATRLSSYLFDDQKLLTRQALDAKRFALWCACGFGKTPMGLEYARQVQKRTGGRVLIITLNEIISEWLEMAGRFYGNRLPLHRIRSRQELREWAKSGKPGVGITNYEKFNPDEQGEIITEIRHLAGVVLDEAGRLRASGGRQKWSLVKSCRGVEYKLCLTATPAPNDLMEFASQASFLEKMRTESDIIWTFFTRDPLTKKWTVKPHARTAFFEWMSSWSVYVHDPRRYGWRLDQPEVPEPEYRVIEVEPTPEQQEFARTHTADVQTGQLNLFGGRPAGIVGRGKMSQAAKGFQYRKKTSGRGVEHKAFMKLDGSGRSVDLIPSLKPGVVAGLVRQEHTAGAQVLVWTTYDAETEILLRLLGGLHGVDSLSGKVPAKDRPTILERFRRGDTRVLVGRSSMLGYGMNFQFCTAMIFSGFTDSFEQLYQSIRRAVRFGQTERVRVYFPVVRELEGEVFDNLDRKQREFLRSIEDMEQCYINARKGLKGAVSGK